MKNFILFSLLCLGLFISCQNSSEFNSVKLPPVSGQPGELVIVMPLEQWQGPIGDSISEYFQMPYQILPQYEPRLQIEHRDWVTYNKYFLNARNVLIVNVEEVVANREAKTVVRKKTNAEGQLIFEIIARTESDFMMQLQENAESIMTAIEDREVERMSNLRANKRNTEAEKTLLETQNIFMEIPKFFRVDVNEPNFVWITGPSYDGKKAAVQEGILIYHCPYTSEDMFNREEILVRRDSVLKENVPGPSDDSYMKTTYYEGYNPIYREVNFDNQYAVELKGLWELENVKKGGPFVSITMVDEQRGRLVTAEAFVHAPGNPKKEMIRKLEAAVKTLRFPVLQSSELLQDSTKTIAD